MASSGGGNVLQWVFELFDRVSGPARTASKELDKLDETMKKASGGAAKVDDAVDKAGKSAEKSKGSWQNLAHTFHDVIESGFYVFELLESMAEKVAHVFEEIDFKQSLTDSLTAIMGDAEQAALAFDYLDRLALKTGDSMKIYGQSARQFAAAGFGTEDIRVLTVAMSDVNALFGSSAGQTFADHIQQIQSGIHLGTRHMETLNRQGISSAKVYENIGRYYGVSAKEAEKMVKLEQVRKDVAVSALLDTVRGYEGGTLGIAAQKHAELFESLVARTKASFMDLFQDLDHNGALDPLKNMFHEVLDFMSPTSSTGKALREGIGDFVREDLVPALETLWKMLKMVGEGWRQIFSTNWREGFSDIWAGIKTSAKEIGNDVGRSIVDGIKHGMLDTLLTAGLGPIGKALYDAVSGPEPKGIDAHSPSKMFERLGRYGAEGYQLGLQSGAAGVSIGDAPPARAAGSRGAVGPVSVTIHVNGSHGDSNELAARVREATLAGLINAFEQLGLEGGTV